MTKFFSREDVLQANQRLMSKSTPLRDELSTASQKIVRDTRLSRQEINAAFKEARRRLTDAK